MDHQDWKPVIFSKPKKSIVETKKTTVVKKNLNSNSISNVNIKKMEAEDVKVEYIPKSIGKEIQQARTALKLSQQDLANRLSVKKNVINDLESGKMVKNNQFVSKVKRILNIK